LDKKVIEGVFCFVPKKWIYVGYESALTVDILPQGFTLTERFEVQRSSASASASNIQQCTQNHGP
jgi:hypothetical protein